MGWGGRTPLSNLTDQRFKGEGVCGIQCPSNESEAGHPADTALPSTENLPGHEPPGSAGRKVPQVLGEPEPTSQGMIFLTHLLEHAHVPHTFLESDYAPGTVLGSVSRKEKIIQTT